MAFMGRVEGTPVFVHLLPSLIPSGLLRGGVAVVMDVLRATTVMTHALAAGAKAIFPTLSIEEAQDVAASLPAGTAILAGERQGLRIPGFDRGNSPGDFTPELCRDKSLVMTTTNGTVAIMASLEAERTFIASFANLSATAGAVEDAVGGARVLHLVCSGTDGEISLEDSLLAGALMSALDQPRDERSMALEPANDSALIVAAQWREVSRDFGSRPLASVIRLGRGGRRVRQIGLDPDIDLAAAVDQFNLIAEIHRDPPRIEARTRG